MVRAYNRLVSAPLLVLTALVLPNYGYAQTGVLPGNLNVVASEQAAVDADQARRNRINTPAYLKHAFEQRNDPQRQARFQKAIDAQERHTKALMKNPGIVGTGVTWSDNDTAVVKVFTENGASAGGIPTSVDGIPVVVEAIGKIYALNVGCEVRGTCEPAVNVDASASTQPPNQRDWHPRPVPIGVSTGHTDVTAGTLGCRVSAGCHTYALSNAHVYADENDGLVGDNVLQPGVFDGGINPDDAIGSLYASIPIVMTTSATNRVDAAIALTDDSQVGTATRTNGYGEPKSQTVNPSAGLQVMKYGRSSAQTYGYIDTYNAIVNVTYSGGVARFVNQIIIRSNDSTDFSRSGDSGSLIVVEDVNGGGVEGANHRKPVGLLFASGTDITVANRITDVLSELNDQISDTLEIDGEL